MPLNKEEETRPKGLSLHTQAPLINTVDIFSNPVNLSNLIQNHNAVLIDFFRGTW